jgi:hypothetical protein
VEAPPLQDISGRLVACHRAEELELTGVTNQGVAGG